MLYTSEKTNKSYKTIPELEAAEAEYDKKQEQINKAKIERSEAAKKVEEALKAVDTAKAAAEKALKDFNNKYGAYHRSYIIDKDKLETDNAFVDLVNSLFNLI